MLTRLTRAVAAALRTPTVIASRLPSLLAPAVATGAAPPADIAAVLRDAQRGINVLARLPGEQWRTTCLYRSVAECLVLRSYGLPARVVLGVLRDAQSVKAHAWVECEGVACTCLRGEAEYSVLG